MFCKELGKLQNKNTLKFYLELSINNFHEKEKMKEYLVDCSNILIIRIGNIGFHVNVISQFVSTTILYFFVLHNLLKGAYYGFYLVVLK